MITDKSTCLGCIDFSARCLYQWSLKLVLLLIFQVWRFFNGEIWSYVAWNLWALIPRGHAAPSLGVIQHKHAAKKWADFTWRRAQSRTFWYCEPSSTREQPLHDRCLPSSNCSRGRGLTGREVAILFRYIFLAGKTRYSCDGALSIYQLLSSPTLTGLHCKMCVYVCLFAYVWPYTSVQCG